MVPSKSMAIRIKYPSGAFLKREQRGIPDAGLDLAIESLYPHTDFQKMGHKSINEQSKTRLNLSRERTSSALREIITSDTT
jgi:hypothetical protein